MNFRAIIIKIVFIILTVVSLFFGSCDAIINNPVSFARIQKREMVIISSGTYNQTDGTNSFTNNISSFHLAKYEVTYELWWAVYRWAISHGYTFAHPGCEGNDGIAGATPTDAKYAPVTAVNWRDAIVWCNAYSEAANRLPCFRYDGLIIKDSTDTNAVACDNTLCDWALNGFRLPSEGEWQFAASDKGITPWNYAAGSASDHTHSIDSQNVAWYSANSGGSTKAVGGKTANLLGIYDMSGNVGEMCWDVANIYPSDPQTDFRGSPLGTDHITNRGGSWNDDSSSLVIGYRSWGGSQISDMVIGFRVATTY